MIAMACDDCLRRTWLLAVLSGHINRARRGLIKLLGTPDRELIAAVGGKAAAEMLARHAAWGPQDAAQARHEARTAGLELICRCEERYPEGLADLDATAPHVLHVAGGLERFLSFCDARPVAIVGSRRCSAYGRDLAHQLAADLARTGITVVSGMAAGIDSAAHRGALAAHGNTIAVMPGAANLSYPASASGLHQRIMTAGVTVSEMAPRSTARAWSFCARNRILVALSAGVVVVQANQRSGSMRTAELAEWVGRDLGATPGLAGAASSAGTHLLIKQKRATLVENATDILDLLHLPLDSSARRIVSEPRRAPVSKQQRQILELIADGSDTAASLAASGISPTDLLKNLAQLELEGWIRQRPGGQFALSR